MPSIQYEDWARDPSEPAKPASPDLTFSDYITLGFAIALSILFCPLWLPFYIIGRVAAYFGARP